MRTFEACSRRVVLGALVLPFAGCGASRPVNPTLTHASPTPIAVADALEALIAQSADSSEDREYAYERVRAREPKTAEEALARAIVSGRKAQISGLAAPGHVAEVERYARLSTSLDPTFRHGAAQRLLGTLYVMAPAALLAHGDSETGLELLEDVVRKFPADPTNHLRLAEAYLSLGDPEPSKPHLCFCAAHRAELRRDEQKLLGELDAQAKLLRCP